MEGKQNGGSLGRSQTGREKLGIVSGYEERKGRVHKEQRAESKRSKPLHSRTWPEGEKNRKIEKEICQRNESLKDRKG